jgi:REP element-mobilizing transposase RayT
MIRIPVRSPDTYLPSRWSPLPGGHFLTVNCRGRKPGLATPHFNFEFHAALHLLVLEGQWQVRSAVVMPYYVHLHVHLPAHLDTATVLQRFKDRLTPCLEPTELTWEDGYCDRRIAPGEDCLALFHYLYHSPYEAGLIPSIESWPGYYCTEGDWRWFRPLARRPCEYPPWLTAWRMYTVVPTPA